MVGLPWKNVLTVHMMFDGVSGHDVLAHFIFKLFFDLYCMHMYHTMFSGSLSLILTPN